MGRKGWAKCTAIAALLIAAVGPPAAHAAAPLGLSDCGRTLGVFQCEGLVRTWDGVPLDTTVTLPDRSSRHLPLVVEVNGFGNSKYEYLDPASTAYTDNAFAWARDGYAVLTYTARGLWESCGSPLSRLAHPVACARGYIHLADVRYEVRDSQNLIGRLVDDGVADPGRIGVTGDSYGGGQSFILAALRDRVMLPSGRLIPWRSPDGRPLSLAAAAPVIPWTDLISAATPNGRTLSYTIFSSDVDSGPVGVEKATFVNAIFAAAQFATGPGQPPGEPFIPGQPMGFLAPPGLDPEADVYHWVSRTDAGEPYTGRGVQAIVRTLRRYHSAYYIDPSHRPPPLFVASGFTDDLFPVDEALRYVNRTRAMYPHAPISLLFGDFGHQRAAQKADVRSRLLSELHAWFDHYLKGAGDPPAEGVIAYTQTCPRGDASGGPFHASAFGRLARGEVRRTWTGERTVLSTPGNPLVGVAIDPATGGGDDCAATSTGRGPGTQTYSLPPARGDGYTLVGAPTVIARLQVSGVPAGVSQLAARLWDVARDGQTQTLVARGLYRPTEGSQVWQLHPAAWTFRRGHVAKLELLGSDAPFARPSNGVFAIDIRRLELRIPVRERPDCDRILQPAPPVIPAGQRLAPGAGPLRSATAC